MTPQIEFVWLAVEGAKRLHAYYEDPKQMPAWRVDVSLCKTAWDRPEDETHGRHLDKCKSCMREALNLAPPDPPKCWELRCPKCAEDPGQPCRSMTSEGVKLRSGQGKALSVRRTHRARVVSHRKWRNMVANKLIGQGDD